jgi:imidazolonepropionase
MPASTLLTGISELTTNDDTRIASHEHLSPAARAQEACAAASRLHDAAVVIESDRIVWVGRAAQAPAADTRIDLDGRAVLPGWVDSHSHMVFGGDRTREFEARMSGAAYKAGGIHTTVQATRMASDAELADNLRSLVREARRGGTTTLETKTGYGLTVADEVRSARIAGEAVDRVTFLGAHVVPEGQAAKEYVRLVSGDMLRAVEPYVSGIDVFCERGAFDENQARSILQTGKDRGLAVHVHGNQLEPGPGVQLAVDLGAASVDHVGYLTSEDIEALAGSWEGELTRGTIATVLPACDLSTRVDLAPARALLDANIPVAIASNCNPGTSYTTSMSFAVTTAVLQMRLSIAEAVRAATLGGAMSLGMDPHSCQKRAGDSRHPSDLPVGVIQPGARADLHVLEAPSVTHLAYRPGVPLTHRVWRKGVEQKLI